ncbi:hypothetical protein K435DRAFT_804374 [Dendrothele bispora CBS 962.96]|uniref:Amidohydrolase 3 domain-containing protein n=1 Tax=Dendrothele bispora (strain CBS 962.96) TaxID=1314807 RepID=A0A4S8LF98_DENBC|nr:hypothetical protein K435DRAFT_804374 [Dendrothele bispora CBS 962.96]
MFIGAEKCCTQKGIFLDSAQEFIKTATLDKVYEQRFSFTVEDALKNGITAMHDAGRTKKYGDLPIQIYAMHSFRNSVLYWRNSTEKLEHGRLIICDDDPTNFGFMRLSAGLLNEVVPRSKKDCWQVNAHAIGDRANGIVLDAFKKVVKEVIASIQPTHAITLGSDIPVESINPLEGFYAAITRADKEGMTIDPAYASFLEDLFGSLGPGKKANYMVLSKDIIKIEPKEVLRVEVLATGMDGKSAFDVGLWTLIRLLEQEVSSRVAKSEVATGGRPAVVRESDSEEELIEGDSMDGISTMKDDQEDELEEEHDDDNVEMENEREMDWPAAANFENEAPKFTSMNNSSHGKDYRFLNEVLVQV